MKSLIACLSLLGLLCSPSYSEKKNDAENKKFDCGKCTAKGCKDIDTYNACKEHNCDLSTKCKKNGEKALKHEALSAEDDAEA